MHSPQRNIMDNKPIYHGNLKNDWPVVRAGIEQIREHDPDPDYIPEDIYHSIKSGGASLYMTESRESFAIVQRYHDGRTGDVVAKVLFTFLRPPDKMAELEVALMDVCRDAGCKRMECETYRTGFERSGWKKGLTTYTKGVE